MSTTWLFWDFLLWNNHFFLNLLRIWPRALELRPELELPRAALCPHGEAARAGAPPSHTKWGIVVKPQAVAVANVNSPLVRAHHDAGQREQPTCSCPPWCWPTTPAATHSALQQTCASFARLYLASVTLGTADFGPLDLDKISLMSAQIVTLINNQVVIYLSQASFLCPDLTDVVTSLREQSKNNGRHLCTEMPLVRWWGSFYIFQLRIWVQISVPDEEEALTNLVVPKSALYHVWLSNTLFS